MDPPLTVQTYATRWLAQLRPVLRPTTWRNYEQGLRLYLLPTLGARGLAQLTRREIRELALALRARGLAPGTVRLALAIVRALCASAVDDELLERNPALALGRSLRHHLNDAGPRPGRALTPQQLATFLGGVERHWPAFFPLFLFLARTGCRVGEGLAMRWTDVDLDGRLALVTATWHGRWAETPTKNGRPCWVDLSQQLVAVLRRHRLRTPGAYLFPSPRGVPWHPGWIVEIMHRVCAAEHLPAHFTPHHLRHSFVTHLLTRGAPLPYVQRAVNHSSPAITMRYAATLPAARPDLVDGLDTLPASPGPGRGARRGA